MHGLKFIDLLFFENRLTKRITIFENQKKHILPKNERHTSYRKPKDIRPTENQKNHDIRKPKETHPTENRKTHVLPKTVLNKLPNKIPSLQNIHPIPHFTQVQDIRSCVQRNSSKNLSIQSNDL